MPLVIIKPDDPPWEECKTLEEWVSKSLEEGREAEVLAMIKTLPEISQEKHRELWVKKWLEMGKEREVIAMIRAFPESRRAKYRDIWVLHKQSKKERQ